METASFLGSSAEEGKRKWGSGWAAKADWRGEAKRCFGAVGRLGEFSGFGAFWRLQKPSETVYGLALKMLPWSPLEKSICQESRNSKFPEVLMWLISHAVERAVKNPDGLAGGIDLASVDVNEQLRLGMVTKEPKKKVPRRGKPLQSDDYRPACRW